MYKKAQSSREPLTLQPPPFLQPTFLPGSQNSVRVSPIHSPTNHLHLRTIRSKGNSPTGIAHNHPLLSQSPPKDAFYLLRGFATVSYVHPTLKTPVENPKTAKETVSSPKEKPASKVIVVKKQKTERQASSSSRATPALFFQEDKRPAYNNVAWPVQTEGIATEPSHIQYEQFKGNLVDSREGIKSTKGDKSRFDETIDIGYAVKQNIERFLTKNIVNNKKERKGGANKLSETEVVQVNVSGSKATSPKENFSITSKVYWKNKDTSAHLMGLGSTKSTRSQLNSSQTSFRNELRSREGQGNPDYVKEFQDIPISPINRPKTMSSDRKKIDLKFLEASQSQWSYGFKAHNNMNFDSPLSLITPASQGEGSPEKVKTVSNMHSPKKSVTIIKDQKSLKSLATIVASKTVQKSGTMHQRKKSAVEVSEKSRQSAIFLDKTSLLEEKSSPAVRLNWPFMSKFAEQAEEREKEIEDKEIVQRNVYKSSTQGMARLDKLPREVEGVYKEIDKLNLKLFAVSIIKKSKKVEPTDANFELFRTDKRRINDLDVMIIQEEYKKKAIDEGSPDYGRVEKLINGLKFFSTLTKPVRMKLLRNATYASYNAGDVIFKQGEVGNMMYIILKGAVNVKVTRLTQYETLETVTVGVLYDGGYFGESAMGAQDNKKEHAAFRPKTSNHQLDAINLETGLDWKLEAKNNRGVYRREEPEPTRLLGQIGNRMSLGEVGTKDEFQEKRSATIEVSESCALLCVPIKDYQQICLNIVQKEVDRKIQALQTLPFLADLDRFAILPIANILVLKSYKYGEVIISAGEKIDRLRIVASGKCNLVIATVRKTPFESPEQEKARLELAIKFQTGLADYTCRETSVRDSDPITAAKATERALEIYKNSKRSFNHDKIGFEDGSILYLEHISLGTIAQGGNFGGRALLSKGDFLTEDPDQQKKASLALLEPAKVSVVADTAEVEIFELSRENFESIPDFLGKILKLGLKSSDEFDAFDIEEEIGKVEQWSKFKNKELNGMAKGKDGDLAGESSR